MKLTETDKDEAIESLKLLIKGISIKDDEGNLIGFIEKPDLNAIKYVIETFNKSNTLNWDND